MLNQTLTVLPSRLFHLENCSSTLCIINMQHNIYYYHSMQTFLPFHWPKAQQVTCKWLPTNNGLLMRNVVQLCLAANNILLMRKRTIFIKKQTWWSNDKTIIELGYCKILWFASVSHINNLPQPSASKNNWSAHHWKITIFCSTSSNNC